MSYLSRIIYTFVLVLCFNFLQGQQGVVNSTSLGFTVTELGTAVYNFPIDLPSLYSSIRPSISISYNHLGSEGLLGQGFSLLGAVSKITRSSKSFYYDGVVSNIKFDDLQDEFSIDGNRLLRQSDGSYRMVGDPYTVIKYNNTSHEWEVISVSGKRSIYKEGRTTNISSYVSPVCSISSNMDEIKRSNLLSRYSSMKLLANEIAELRCSISDSAKLEENRVWFSANILDMSRLVNVDSVDCKRSEPNINSEYNPLVPNDTMDVYSYLSNINVLPNYVRKEYERVRDEKSGRLVFKEPSKVLDSVNAILDEISLKQGLLDGMSKEFSSILSSSTKEECVYPEKTTKDGYYEWYISEVRDAMGDVMRYSYNKLRSSDEGYLLDSIRYNNVKVAFTYETRNKEHIYGLSHSDYNVEVALRLRMSRIDVFQNESLYRRYTLSYTPGDKLLLIDPMIVNQKGNQVLFSWDNSSSGEASREYPYIVDVGRIVLEGKQFYSIKQGDFNGDDKLDLVVLSKAKDVNSNKENPTRNWSHLSVYINESGGFRCVLSDFLHDVNSIVLGDVDGDALGLDEILEIFSEGEGGNLYYKWNGNGFDKRYGGHSFSHVSLSPFLEYSIVDINSDGKQDLLEKSYRNNVIEYKMYRRLRQNIFSCWDGCPWGWRDILEDGPLNMRSLSYYRFHLNSYRSDLLLPEGLRAPVSYNGLKDVALFDFDGDGVVDVTNLFGRIRVRSQSGNKDYSSYEEAATSVVTKKEDNTTNKINKAIASVTIGSANLFTVKKENSYVNVGGIRTHMNDYKDGNTEGIASFITLFKSHSSESVGIVLFNNSEGGDFFDDGTFDFSDINGDGIADALLPKSNRIAFFSKGGMYFKKTNIDLKDIGEDKNDGSIMKGPVTCDQKKTDRVVKAFVGVHDMNGDGKGDVVRVRRKYTKVGEEECYSFKILGKKVNRRDYDIEGYYRSDIVVQYNLGADVFDYEEKVLVSDVIIPDDGGDLFFSDFNSDGSVDILINEKTTEGYSLPSKIYYSKPKYSKSLESLVVGIVHGSKSVKINYGTCKNNVELYKKTGDKLLFPVEEIYPSFKVVSSFSMTNDIGGEDVFKFYYEGLKSHKRKGLLGFSKQSITNERGGTVLTMLYDLYGGNKNHFGLSSKTLKSLSSGSVIREEHTSYSFLGVSDLVYMPVVSAIEVSDNIKKIREAKKSVYDVITGKVLSSSYEGVYLDKEGKEESRVVLLDTFKYTPYGDVSYSCNRKYVNNLSFSLEQSWSDYSGYILNKQVSLKDNYSGINYKTEILYNTRRLPVFVEEYEIRGGYQFLLSSKQLFYNTGNHQNHLLRRVIDKGVDTVDYLEYDAFENCVKKLESGVLSSIRYDVLGRVLEEDRLFEGGEGSKFYRSTFEWDNSIKQGSITSLYKITKKERGRPYTTEYYDMWDDKIYEEERLSNGVLARSISYTNSSRVRFSHFMDDNPVIIKEAKQDHIKKVLNTRLYVYNNRKLLESVRESVLNMVSGSIVDTSILRSFFYGQVLRSRVYEKFRLGFRHCVQKSVQLYDSTGNLLLDSTGNLLYAKSSSLLYEWKVSEHNKETGLLTRSSVSRFLGSALLYTKTERTLYDAFFRARVLIDTYGDSTFLEFDTKGRLVSKFKLGLKTSYSYNSRGDLLQERLNDSLLKDYSELHFREGIEYGGDRYFYKSVRREWGLAEEISYLNEFKEVMCVVKKLGEKVVSEERYKRGDLDLEYGYYHDISNIFSEKQVYTGVSEDTISYVYKYNNIGFLERVYTINKLKLDTQTRVDYKYNSTWSVVEVMERRRSKTRGWELLSVRGMAYNDYMQLVLDSHTTQINPNVKRVVSKFLDSYGLTTKEVSRVYLLGSSEIEKSVSYEYDARGYLSKERDAYGIETVYEMNSEGLPLVKKKEGIEFSYIYDKYNRLLEERVGGVLSKSRVYAFDTSRNFLGVTSFRREEIHDKGEPSLISYYNFLGIKICEERKVGGSLLSYTMESKPLYYLESSSYQGLSYYKELYHYDKLNHRRIIKENKLDEYGRLSKLETVRYDSLPDSVLKTVSVSEYKYLEKSNLLSYNKEVSISGFDTMLSKLELYKYDADGVLVNKDDTYQKSRTDYVNTVTVYDTVYGVALSRRRSLVYEGVVVDARLDTFLYDKYGRDSVYVDWKQDSVLYKYDDTRNLLVKKTVDKLVKEYAYNAKEELIEEKLEGRVILNYTRGYDKSKRYKDQTSHYYMERVDRAGNKVIEYYNVFGDRFFIENYVNGILVEERGYELEDSLLQYSSYLNKEDFYFKGLYIENKVNKVLTKESYEYDSNVYLTRKEVKIKDLIRGEEILEEVRSGYNFFHVLGRRDIKSRGSGASYEEVRSYGYGRNGLLSSDSVWLGSDSVVVTLYTYDRDYNVVEKKEHLEDLRFGVKLYERQLLYNEYDVRGRLLKEKRFGEDTIFYSYNPDNTLSSIRQLGIEEHRLYDAVLSRGEFKLESMPSFVVDTTYDTSVNVGINRSVRVITKKTLGKPSIWEYYDAYGQKLRREEESYNAMDSRVCRRKVVDYHYDLKGLLIKESIPYYKDSDAQIEYIYYEYDEYHRKVKTSIRGVDYITLYDDVNRVQTEYDGKGFLNKRTLDVYGEAISVVDSAGIIEYKFNSRGNTVEILKHFKDSLGFYGTPILTEIGYKKDQSTREYLSDPSAGVIRYTYGDNRQLSSEVRGDYITLYTYDSVDRLKSKHLLNKGDKQEILYYYDPLSSRLLKSENISNNTSQEYEYDRYGNVLRLKERVLDKEFITEYSYDSYNRLSSHKYPGGVIKYYEYDVISSVIGVSVNNGGSKVWSRGEESSDGRVLNYKTNNGIYKTTYDYSTSISKSLSRISITNTKSSRVLQSQEYVFEAESQNLKSRVDVEYKSDAQQYKESYSYDVMDRLVNVESTRPLGEFDYVKSVSYDSKGLLLKKSDVGEYKYNDKKPYQLDSISLYCKDETCTSPAPYESEVYYNVLNKPDSIVYKKGEVYYVSRFTYLPNGDRVKMTLSDSRGRDSITKYYAVDYEIKEDKYRSVDDTFSYIESPTTGLLVSVVSNGLLMYVHNDYQGSIVGWLNPYGELVSSYSYDAWGRPRSYDKWLLSEINIKSLLPPFDRGYTGHEHLSVFGYINMNARLYDYQTGRMLGCDNEVQDRYYSQNYNRYAYAWNNPLKYQDPDGNSIFRFLLFIPGVYQVMQAGAAANGGDWNTSKWKWNERTRNALIDGAVAGMIARTVIAASALLTVVTGGAAAPLGALATTAVMVGTTLIGAYIGGAIVNKSWNPLKWDYKSSKTWKGILAGAAIGATAGYGIASLGWAASGIVAVKGSIVQSLGYLAQVSSSPNGFADFRWSDLGKAAVTGVVTSVAAAGVGGLFGTVRAFSGPDIYKNILKELARASAHAVVQGSMFYLQGGEFMQGFGAGFVSSAFSSMSHGLLPASSPYRKILTPLLGALGGALGAWAGGGRGDDIFKGAMNGLLLSFFNHEQHDQEEEKRKYGKKSDREDKQSIEAENIEGEMLEEVKVHGKSKPGIILSLFMDFSFLDRPNRNKYKKLKSVNARSYTESNNTLDNRKNNYSGRVNYGRYNVSSNTLKGRLQNFSKIIGKPINVTSGDRSSINNSKAGGASSSRHLHGDAIDISVDGISNLQLAILAKESSLFNTVIYYPKIDASGALRPHVHLDLNPTHNNTFLIYTPFVDNGKVIKNNYSQFNLNR